MPVEQIKIAEDCAVRVDIDQVVCDANRTGFFDD